MASNDWEIPPPPNMTVEAAHRLVLYAPDGSALVRSAGFTRTGQRAMQTSGVNQPLTTGKKPKGKKGPGGRTC